MNYLENSLEPSAEAGDQNLPKSSILADFGHTVRWFISGALNREASNMLAENLAQIMTPEMKTALLSIASYYYQKEARVEQLEMDLVQMAWNPDLYEQMKSILEVLRKLKELSEIEMPWSVNTQLEWRSQTEALREQAGVLSVVC